MRARRRLRWVGILAILMLLVSSTALAHKPSDSYLHLNVTQAQGLTGRWDIALRDLEFAIGLDSNRDAAITWGELQARRQAVFAYTLARLEVASNGQRCTLTAQAMKFIEHSDGGYAVLYFDVGCPQPLDRFTLSYHLFASIDPSHHGLLQVRDQAATQTATLSPGNPSVTIELGKLSRWRAFTEYMVQGIHHIWMGLDHVLFVVTLLLPAVLIYRGRRWQPRTRARSAVLEVVEVVTGFTVGHSLTLSLAVLGVISFPSRVVESVIALTIVLMALNNLYPVVPRGRWVLALIFGLAHGFGFASVLIDLGLPSRALAVALFGFNVGVEIGQLAIVALVLPVAILLRHTEFYRLVVLYGGSLVVAGLAAVWLYQRALGV